MFFRDTAGLRTHPRTSVPPCLNYPTYRAGTTLHTCRWGETLHTVIASHAFGEATIKTAPALINLGTTTSYTTPSLILSGTN